MLEPAQGFYRGVDFCFEGHNSRTKQSHPYSYDAFYIWGGDEARRLNASCDYTDRYWQQNYDRMQSIMKEMRCRFDEMGPKQLQKFVDKWHGAGKFKAVALGECCNFSSGYPIWMIFMVRVEPKKGERDGK